MSDEVDILQKADALLSRRASRSESDFPVLTEVVEAPSAAHTLPAALRSCSERSTNYPHGITTTDILELERRILENVLPTLELRIERLMRSILLPHVREIIERALEMSCKEVLCASTTRAAEELSEAIKEEVQAELSRLRSNATGV